MTIGVTVDSAVDVAACADEVFVVEFVTDASAMIEVA